MEALLLHWASSCAGIEANSEQDKKFIRKLITINRIKCIAIGLPGKKAWMLASPIHQDVYTLISPYLGLKTFLIILEIPSQYIGISSKDDNHLTSPSSLFIACLYVFMCIGRGWKQAFHTHL